MTARRLADGLRNMGYEVKIVSTGDAAENKFVVPPLKLPPVIRGIVSAQGMQFAGIDKETPHTAAFHVQPQNITYSIGMGTAELPNAFLYNLMRDHFF